MATSTLDREQLINTVINETLRTRGVRRAVVLGEGSSLSFDTENALRRALLAAVPRLSLPERLQVEGTSHAGFRIVNLTA